MKDDLGFPIAGWEELRDRAVEAEAELAAAKTRIGELEQERGAEGTNWFPDSFVSQLQDQLREVTERCDHFCKMALVPDGTESRKEIDALQAQLAAVTQQYNEQFSAAAELARAVTSMDERLAAVTQERDQLREENETDDTNVRQVAREIRQQDEATIAHLQAHNGELLDLCRVIAEDEGLNDLIQCIGEEPDWWKPLRAALAASPEAQP